MACGWLYLFSSICPLFAHIEGFAIFVRHYLQLMFDACKAFTLDFVEVIKFVAFAADADNEVHILCGGGFRDPYSRAFGSVQLISAAIFRL